ENAARGECCHMLLWWDRGYNRYKYCVMDPALLDYELQLRVAFTVQEFQLEDLENLWRIDQECFPPGISYSRQELRFYVRRRGAITLVAAARDREEAAAVRGEIGGFIVAHPGHTGHIVTIDVLASARRAGVGSVLLRPAEDRLR